MGDADEAFNIIDKAKRLSEEAIKAVEAKIAFLEKRALDLDQQSRVFRASLAEQLIELKKPTDPTSVLDMEVDEGVEGIKFSGVNFGKEVSILAKIKGGTRIRIVAYEDKTFAKRVDEFQFDAEIKNWTPNEIELSLIANDGFVKFRDRQLESHSDVGFVWLYRLEDATGKTVVDKLSL